VLAKEIFESKALRKKAFYADDRCLIFCGEVREVLKWLRDANVRVDCMVTSPPFYGQRDYGVAGQLGLLSPCRTKIDCISPSKNGIRSEASIAHCRLLNITSL
jgi:site-specific DNA-methyltransferase (cytosine-N4-specific)